MDNAQDITRSLTCAAELVANHTATKWKFRLQPVGNVLKDMQVRVKSCIKFSSFRLSVQTSLVSSNSQT